MNRNKCYLSCCFIILLFLVTSCSSRGILVKLENDSDKNINQVKISFTGGNKVIEALPAGSETEMFIKSSGESSIIVSYSIDNQLFEKDLDVYFEPSYTGSVKIAFGKDGHIQRDSKITF